MGWSGIQVCVAQRERPGEGVLVGRVSLLPDWHPTLGLMVGLWVHLVD